MISSKPQIITVDQAETLALQAMAFIAQDEDTLNRFLGITGFSLETLKTKLTERTTLAGILQFIMDYEPRLLSFCDHIGMQPTVVTKAWHCLSPDDAQLW